MDEYKKELTGNKIQYKDEDGNLNEGQTLTDLERNNRLMEHWIIILKALMRVLNFVAFFVALAVIYVIAIFTWLIYYVMTNNVVGNILRAIK